MDLNWSIFIWPLFIAINDTKNVVALCVAAASVNILILHFKQNVSHFMSNTSLELKEYEGLRTCRIKPYFLIQRWKCICMCMYMHICICIYMNVRQCNIFRNIRVIQYIYFNVWLQQNMQEILQINEWNVRHNVFIYIGTRPDCIKEFFCPIWNETYALKAMVFLLNLFLVLETGHHCAIIVVSFLYHPINSYRSYPKLWLASSIHNHYYLIP